MAFAAGEVVTASRLNLLQPVTYEAQCTAATNTANATEVDITGASVNITTVNDNAIFVATAVFDMNVLATSSSILMVGKLNIDGATQSGLAVFAMDSLIRATVAETWRGTITSAGAHVFKLRGNLSGTLATGGDYMQTDTKLQVAIYESV